MNVSVMITTKNRLADLQRTCTVLKQLNPAPTEILITADGCSDGTVEYVQTEMPEAKLIINEEGRGSVASRDRMMRAVNGDLVLALDDDSYPEQIDCIAQLIHFFDEHPNVAIAHFPQRTDEYPETLEAQNFYPTQQTGSFANSGACLRRSVYQQLPGFPPQFFHMYEEPDYALQCIGAGYEVVHIPLITIRHHYSGNGRSELKNHHRHARNEFWSALLRCPFPLVILVAAYRIISQFRYALSRGLNWVVQEPVWWYQAASGVRLCLKERQPISWRAYWKWLWLLSHPITLNLNAHLTANTAIIESEKSTSQIT